MSPPPDAIREFRLQASNFSAAFGHSTGAVINAALKSGTNRLHGDLWEYIRNTAFNANDYFTKQQGFPRSRYQQNTFGFTVGGPVYIPKIYNGHNRTFFFFDYQGMRIVSATGNSGVYSNVPTAEMQNSNFTNLQDIFKLAGTPNTDALGRKFPRGTIFDPATTRQIPPSGLDPVTGLTGTPGAYVRDPFFTGGSVAGITDFTGLTSEMNILPADRLDPVAVKILHLYPMPTTTGLVQNYHIVPIEHAPNNSYDIRIDHSISSKDSIFGTWDWIHKQEQIPTDLPGLANGQDYTTGLINEPRYILALGYTHIFSPTMTNEFHAGWINMRRDVLPPADQANTMGIPEKYGIPGIPQSQGNGGLPMIDISSLKGLGVAGWDPTLISSRTLQIMDDVTKTYGSHNFSAGFQLFHIKAPITQPAYPKGEFEYSGQYSDIPNESQGLTGIADFLLTPIPSTVPNGINNLGGLSFYEISRYLPTKQVKNYIAGYFQDNWRMTERLTLNLGLRLDYFQPYTEANGNQANFIMSDGGNGPGGTLYIPNKGCETKRSDGFNAFMAANNVNIVCTSNASVTQSRFTNFAPRLGFAYRVGSHVVARGGYGIVYGNLENIAYGDNLGNNYPFSYNASFTSVNSQTPLLDPSKTSTATIENAFATQNFQNPAEVSENASLTGRQWDYKIPSTQSFNLTLQDQFSSHDSLQAAYVGNVTRHLDRYGTSNSPTAVTPPGTNLFDPTVIGHYPLPNLVPNNPYQVTIGSGNYNSLQITYAHQATNLTTNINYTWAKCMTNTTQGNGGGWRAEWVPGFGIVPDYALCASDVTNTLHASGIYALPFGRGQHFGGGVGGAANEAIGGWKVSYILTYQSGIPFTIGCLQATTQGLGCNANVVPGQGLYARNRGIQQWLNPHAFSQPPVATVAGQTDFAPLGGPAQQVRAPGMQNLDMSVSKVFPIKEDIRVEFRAEAFNVGNWVSLGVPGNNNFNNLNPSPDNPFSNITYDVIGPRIMQFALKLYY